MIEDLAVAAPALTGLRALRQGAPLSTPSARPLARWWCSTRRRGTCAGRARCALRLPKAAVVDAALQRQAAESRVMRPSTRLTGVANRRQFDSVMLPSCTTDAQRRTVHAGLLMSLDGVQDIRNGFWRGGGRRRAAREVCARAWRARSGSGDLLARLSGFRVRRGHAPRARPTRGRVASRSASSTLRAPADHAGQRRRRRTARVHRHRGPTTTASTRSAALDEPRRAGAAERATPARATLELLRPPVRAAAVAAARRRGRLWLDPTA